METPLWYKNPKLQTPDITTSTKQTNNQQKKRKRKKERTKTAASMAFLQLVCVCLVVAVTAMPDGYGHDGAGYSRDIYHSQDGYGKWKFGYNTADHHTGDMHGRHEEGEAHHGVHGNYYLKDPYGYMRSVDYKSDGHGGTYQMVKGSYNGLYVHSPYYSIVPGDKGYH